MRATLLAIPGELVESAELDGAGRMQTLWSIVLPVIRPALTTMVLLMFMWTWNDYFLAFVLINDERMPVTLALGRFSTRYTAQLNLMAAAAVLVGLPVLILYVASSGSSSPACWPERSRADHAGHPLGLVVPRPSISIRTTSPGDQVREPSRQRHALRRPGQHQHRPVPGPGSARGAG